MIGKALLEDRITGLDTDRTAIGELPVYRRMQWTQWIPFLAALIVFQVYAATPSYSAATIYNGASWQTTGFAPNTFITIFGKNLAYTVRAMTAADLVEDHLPIVLSGTGVRVWVNRIAAFIYYVSPTQINALLPTTLGTGPTEVQVQLDSTWGPVSIIQVEKSAPALFQIDGPAAIATHADGSLVTPESPAGSDEYIALYATGLGATMPPVGYGEIPGAAAALVDSHDFRLLLDGQPVDPVRVTYAGIAPGFGGLYQINVKLPAVLTKDPEIQLSTGNALSPRGVKLYTIENRP